MNIIRLRLEKALRIGYRGLTQQRKFGKNRRGSYGKHHREHTNPISVRVSDALKARIDGICALHNVERGMVIRDALTFWLDIAETEPREPVPTKVKRS